MEKDTDRKEGKNKEEAITGSVVPFLIRTNAWEGRNKRRAPGNGKGTGTGSGRCSFVR